MVVSPYYCFIRNTPLDDVICGGVELYCILQRGIFGILTDINVVNNILETPVLKMQYKNCSLQTNIIIKLNAYLSETFSIKTEITIIKVTFIPDLTAQSPVTEKQLVHIQ